MDKKNEQCKVCSKDTSEVGILIDCLCWNCIDKIEQQENKGSKVKWGIS